MGCGLITVASQKFLFFTHKVLVYSIMFILESTGNVTTQLTLRHAGTLSRNTAAHLKTSHLIML